MRILIRNNAQLPNKYLRFIKWKLFRVQRKFQHLIYAEVFLNSEGQSPKEYSATIRLGIPGNDIIIQNKSKDLEIIFKNLSQATHRYLAKKKPSKSKKRNEFFH